MALTNGMRAALRRIGENPQDWEDKPQQEIKDKIQKGNTQHRANRHYNERKKQIEKLKLEQGSFVPVKLRSQTVQREIKAITPDAQLIIEGIAKPISPITIAKYLEELSN